MASDRGPEASAIDERRTTIDELVRHLREAGAKRVYLSKENAFQNDSVSLVATFERQRSEGGAEVADSDDLAGIIEQYSDPAGNESPDQPTRERLASVFRAIGERIWFAGEEWTVDWDVTPSFTDPQVGLVTLYDRGLEHKHGDGFHLRSMLFVYEQYRELGSSRLDE